MPRSSALARLAELIERVDGLAERITALEDRFTSLDARVMDVGASEGASRLTFDDAALDDEDKAPTERDVYAESGGDAANTGGGISADADL